MKSSIKYVIAIIGLAFVVLMIMDFNNRISEMVRLERQNSEIQTEVENLKATQTYLESRAEYATSSAPVIENAYVDERMIQPGDVLVVPLEVEGIEVEATPALPASQTRFEKWEYWFSLFFDR